MTGLAFTFNYIKDISSTEQCNTEVLNLLHTFSNKHQHILVIMLRIAHWIWVKAAEL